MNGIGVTDDSTFMAATAPFRESESVADVTFRTPIANVAQDWSPPDAIPVATPLPPGDMAVETWQGNAHDDEALTEAEIVGEYPNPPLINGALFPADPSGHQPASVSYMRLQGTTGGEP